MCPQSRLRSRAVAVIALAVIASRAAAQDRSTAHGQESDRVRITAIRHWTLENVTRIVIESSGDIRLKSEHLHNPDRLFFDLVGARPDLRSADRNGVSVINVGDRFIRQIRIAETQKGVTRLVCDLASPVKFTTSQLPNPERLIIELRAANESRPELSASIRVSEPAKRTPQRAVLLFSRTLRPGSGAIAIPDPPSPTETRSRFAPNRFAGADPLLNMAWAPRVPALPRPRLSTPIAPAMAPATLRSTRESTAEIGLPARRTSKDDTMIRVLGLKLGRVVIDPGHGGHDNGTSSDGGLHEKDVVLDVAKRLGTLLEARLGSEVVYTRTDDHFIALSRRTGIANEIKADLFLSIHVNSSPVRAVRGVETYYLNFTTSQTALETAMRENAGADRNIGELQDLLKKIALKDKVEESRRFAACVQNSLVTLSPKSARTAHDRGIKRAPFVVLIGASMPSVLAEVGFISNYQDEDQMRRPDYRQKMAEALYRGIAAYANSLSHFQVAQRSNITQQPKLAQKTASVSK